MDTNSLKEMEHKKYSRGFAGIEDHLQPGEHVLAASYRQSSIAVVISVAFLGLCCALDSVSFFRSRMVVGGLAALFGGCALLAAAYWLFTGAKRAYAFVTERRFVYVSAVPWGQKTTVRQVSLPEILEAKLLRSVALNKNSRAGQIIIKTKERKWLVENLRDASSVFHELNNAGHGREDEVFLQT